MSGTIKGLRTTSGWSGVLRLEDWIFTESRLRLWGSGLAVAYAVHLAAQLLKGQWLTLADGTLKKIDFGYIWVSANLAVSSDPARIFDNSAFSSAQLALFGPDNWPVIPDFVYPPTFLLFTYPLGLMPYLIAFMVWTVATLVLYLAAVYAIIPRPASAILALTPCPVLFNVALGQNGFLTAGLVGLSLAFMERGPWLSGIFLGLLTYKPQFGILFPFALLASGNWRVFFSAAATSVVLGITAAMAFGYQGWVSFIYSLADRNSHLGEVPGWQPTLVSIFGFLQSAGASISISWTVHLAVAAIVALTICAIWAKALPHSLKAAALCTGSVVITPYVQGYDLCLLSIAVAFFVKDGLSRGFLPGERVAIFVCWAELILLLEPPIPPIICMVLLVLIVRRTTLGRGETFGAPPLVLRGACGHG